MLEAVSKSDLLTQKGPRLGSLATSSKFDEDKVLGAGLISKVLVRFSWKEVGKKNKKKKGEGVQSFWGYEFHIKLLENRLPGTLTAVKTQRWVEGFAGGGENACLRSRSSAGGRLWPGQVAIGLAMAKPWCREWTRPEIRSSVLFTIFGAVRIELLVVEDVTGKNGSKVMPIHGGKKTQISQVIRDIHVNRGSDFSHNEQR
ncbi:lipoate--protein ligase [Sesbania bispinosa]|nr:lipoate--protein ligase [Sesbania bispinosa]